MDFAQYFLFSVIIFIAGFIDSIAGGGGLITVPAVAILLEPGPLAIGTNKVLALAAASSAFIVYSIKGHFHFKSGIYFSIFVFFGSFLGSQIGSSIDKDIFRWLMIGVCPMMLFLVLNKENFKPDRPPREQKTFLLCLAGLFCGLYDGLLGPGGGTLMLLSLLYLTNMPLLLSIGVSKFANMLSALSSLGGYIYTGNVAWKVGLPFALFALTGAFIGSRLASKKATAIVRPILIFVVLVLMARLALDIFQ